MMNGLFWFIMLIVYSILTPLVYYSIPTISVWDFIIIMLVGAGLKTCIEWSVMYYVDYLEDTEE